MAKRIDTRVQTYLEGVAECWPDSPRQEVLALLEASYRAGGVAYLRQGSFLEDQQGALSKRLAHGVASDIDLLKQFLEQIPPGPGTVFDGRSRGVETVRLDYTGSNFRY